MLRYEAAGIDGPEYLDFHALRHWCITEFAGQEDMAPSTLQALSRHSDPRLTLDRYARGKDDLARKAAEGLPRLGG